MYKTCLLQWENVGLAHTQTKSVSNQIIRDGLWCVDRNSDERGPATGHKFCREQKTHSVEKQAGVILWSAVIDSAVSASFGCEVDKKCLLRLLFYHSQQLPELLSSSGCLKPAYTSYKVISLSALAALDQWHSVFGRNWPQEKVFSALWPARLRNWSDWSFSQ